MPRILVPLIAFSILISLHEQAVVDGADRAVRSAVLGLRSMPADAVMHYASASAGTIPVVVVTGLLAMELFRTRRRVAAGRTVAMVAGGMLLSTVFKVLVDRARPPLEEMITLPSNTASMPSGHTMASLCVGTALVWALMEATPGAGSRIVTWLTVASVAAWVVLVGFSRVYLGAHWPSDVVASWLLGTAWLAAAGSLAGANHAGASGLRDGL